MGRDKAWLRLGGETMLHRIVRLALGAAPRVLVVAGSEQALPTSDAWSPSVTRIDDPRPRAGRGPLAAVLTGLEVLVREGVELAYLSSVDAARLTTNHIRTMLERLAKDASLRAVVPESRARDGCIVHGLSGAVRVAPAAIAADDLLREGVLSIRSLYVALDAQRIDVSDLLDPDVVRGCNTPEEWRALTSASPRESGS
jgi:molybdenum cofactor guanylyltransferase